MGKQFLLAISLPVAMAACRTAPRTDYQSAATVSISHASPEFDQLWRAGQETLRRHRFRLDRVDRRAGRISTFPAISQHFFEFWRRDVASSSDFWEATINPIRRWVEISVTPVAGSDDATRLAVTVHKQRFSAPDRQFNSTIAAYQLFGDRLPTTTGRETTSVNDDRWLDRGRDSAMEEALLMEMIERAGVTSVGSSAPVRSQEAGGEPTANG